jgi:uncharacterized protein with von Willebrand factor type A (vWA) domain
MFVNFFYTLRDKGIPVTPTSFLRLQKALDWAWFRRWTIFTASRAAFWSKANATLIFMIRRFPSHFAAWPKSSLPDAELTEAVRAMLSEWLKDPGGMAQALGMDEDQIKQMTPDELVEHFLKLLKEQTEAHHGGNRWIGSRGTSRRGTPAVIRAACGWAASRATSPPSKWRWSAATGIIRIRAHHGFADRRGAQKAEAPAARRAERRRQHR